MLRDEIKRFESYEDLASAAEMWWSRYGKPEYCGSYIESRRKTYTYPIFVSFHLNQMDDGEVCGIGVRALTQSEFEQLFKLYPIGGKYNEVTEQFEKLPEIVERIESLDFNEHTKEYESSLMCCSNEAYVSGAWYSFQEQQKKIEAIKAIAEKWENTEYTYNSDSTDTKIEQMRACGREIIQELLK